MLSTIQTAISNLKADEAQQLIESALQQEPGHPDFLCEKAILSCYMQREVDAVTLFPKVKGAAREMFLIDTLRNHFFCRLQQEPNNREVKRQLERFSTLTDSTLDHIGAKISAILIVKDEADSIADCLTSLAGLVDEIVVVDTGSTDNTVEIAESFGAVIGHFPWSNDFAAARNASLELATGNWAFWIDADEILSEGAAKAIQRATCRPHFGAYYIDIVNFTDDRIGGDEFVHNAVRLFRKAPGVTFTGAIHEQIIESIRDLGLAWARLEGLKILHSGYRPAVVEAKGKAERTISMLREVVAKHPEDAFQRFNLANALAVEKDYEGALENALLSLQYCTEELDYVDLNYQICQTSLMGLGRHQEALAFCDRADGEAHGGLLNEFERSSCLLAMGRFDEALLAIDRCIQHPWHKHMVGDRSIADSKRFVVRGQILGHLGRFAEADIAIEGVLNHDGEDCHALYVRAWLFEERGQLQDANRFYHRAAQYPATRSQALKGVERCQFEDFHTPKSEYLSNPEDDALWLKWFESCRDSGDGAGCLDSFETFARLRTIGPDRLVDWGRILEQLGQIEESLEKFQQAIDLDSTYTNAYFNAGDLLYKYGTPLDAAQAYEAGLRYSPLHEEGWFALGNCLAKLDMCDAAATCYRSTLSLNPAHTGALHNLEMVQLAHAAA